MFYGGVVMEMGKEVGVSYTWSSKSRLHMEAIVGFFCFCLPVVVVVFIVVVDWVLFLGLTQSELHSLA